MSRIREHVMPILLTLVGISAIVGLALMLFSSMHPEIAGQGSSGNDILLLDLKAEGASVADLPTFRPVFDLLLLTGSYVLVCLMIWAQVAVRSYFKNRHHFE